MITTQLSGPELEVALQPYFQASGYAKDTQRAYLGDIECFLRFLRAQGGGREFAEVSDTDVADYLAYLKASGRSARPLRPLTICRRLAALSSYFQYLIRTGHCSKNPVTSVDRAHLSRRSPGQTITTKAVEKLLNAPAGDGFGASRDRALLEVLYRSGITTLQLTHLDVADVNLPGEVIRVRHRRGLREIPIGSFALQAVKAYLVVRDQVPHHRPPGDEPLFINRFGGRLSRRSVGKVFERYRQSVGLPLVNPSTLRRSFARHLLDRGTPLSLVQEVLGHAQLATTRYVVGTTNVS